MNALYYNKNFSVSLQTMAEIIAITLFIVSYILISLEHYLDIEKPAPALIAGALIWITYFYSVGGGHGHGSEVVHQLEMNIAEIAGIIFFLLGAMTIVELIDQNEGFKFITNRIKTSNKRILMVIITTLSFFLSAILDNLTTAIVMASIINKLFSDIRDKQLYAGMVVIAANAGGAWSPIGDVTTTMLWIGGQITTMNIIAKVFLPSVVALIIPLGIVLLKLDGVADTTTLERSKLHPANETDKSKTRLRAGILYLGIFSLLMVPVIKTVIGVPPYIGMLLSLGFMWFITEIITRSGSKFKEGLVNVSSVLERIDTPSIMFFLGILLAVGGLSSMGILEEMARWLDGVLPNKDAVAYAIGILSSVVDNVPLVAAVQKMYHFPTDHKFWEFLAYTAGTGGSILIIGSAAGVAIMGIHKLEFFWYLKKIGWLAFIGYTAGAGVYLLQHMLLHG